MIIAALLSLPAVFLEDSNSHTAHEVGYIAGFALWLVFLAEIVVMLAVVPSRSRWLRDHPLDLAIVLLTPPFVFTTLQGLRILRVLRPLRLFRVAPFLRRAFTPEGLRYISLLALLTLLVSAEAYSTAEKTSFGEGM